jgi:hypothetical protein
VHLTRIWFQIAKSKSGPLSVRARANVSYVFLAISGERPGAKKSTWAIFPERNFRENFRQ